MSAETPGTPASQPKGSRSTTSATKIRNWKAAIGTVSAIIIGIASILSLVYQAGWLLPSPDIRFVQNGPLKVDNTFVEGITIFNRGNKTANNVEIIITHDASEIKGSYDEKSFLDKPEITYINNNKRATFKLYRISPKKENGVIYITYPSNAAGETQVNVRYDEGEGISGIYERSWGDSIFLSWGIFSAIICIWYFTLRKLLIRGFSTKQD